MAAHPHSGPADPIAGHKLSAEASRFYASVYGSARKGSIAELCRRGCSAEEAEEFFSTAFEKVMRTVDPVGRGFSAPQMVNFIKRAAWRAMLDERRRRGQRPEIELGAIKALSDAGAESPDEVAEEREAVAIGREALQVLSERDRLIFRQRHQLDLSPEEILQQTPGLSLRTYRKIIQRANGRVLAAFERIEGGERCEEMESSLLRRYVADQCPEPEQVAVEVHLAHCRACQMAHARMRGYLLDVASGLAVAASSAGGNRLGAIAGLPVRLADAAANGAQSALEATRAARERSRELILRIFGGVPGAGGDTTVGQALTATSVKVASACAAGVAAGACVAAGVVPGIGGIGLLGGHTHQGSPAAKTVPQTRPAKSASTFVDPLPETESTPVPSGRQEAKRIRGGRQANVEHASSTLGSSAPPSESSSAPKEIQEVNSGEFFDESGQPAASAPAPSSSVPSGSGTGSSGGSAGSSGGKTSSEFGL